MVLYIFLTHIMSLFPANSYFLLFSSFPAAETRQSSISKEDISHNVASQGAMQNDNNITRPFLEIYSAVIRNPRFFSYLLSTFLYSLLIQMFIQSCRFNRFSSSSGATKLFKKAKNRKLCIQQDMEHIKNPVCKKNAPLSTNTCFNFPCKK